MKAGSAEDSGNSIGRKEITFWVSIIALAISLAVTWGAIRQQVEVLNRDVTNLRAEFTAYINKCDQDNDDIFARLVRIETQLLYIRGVVEESP